MSETTLRFKALFTVPAELGGVVSARNLAALIQHGFIKEGVAEPYHPEPVDNLPVGKGLAPEPYLPRLDAKVVAEHMDDCPHLDFADCKCEVVCRVVHNGFAYDLPYFSHEGMPESETDKWETTSEALVAYERAPGELFEGFTVEYVPEGEGRLLPLSMRIRTQKVGGKVVNYRAVCMHRGCKFSADWLEGSMGRAESVRDLMRKYVLGIMQHINSHGEYNPDEWCEHGQRKYVRRDTTRKGVAQVWAAYFCPVQDPKHRCEPIWDNSAA